MTPLSSASTSARRGRAPLPCASDFPLPAIPPFGSTEFGQDPRSPSAWWQAVQAALTDLLSAIDRATVRAIAVDGTSGTLLPVDAAGRPLAEPLMYNDKMDDADILAAIAREAPQASAAHGATSGLAKALRFAAPGIAAVLHQADGLPEILPAASTSATRTTH